MGIKGVYRGVMKKLTQKRAMIIAHHFWPFLDANVEARSGDLYDVGLDDYTPEDIQAALDWIWEQSYKRLQNKDNPSNS